MKKFIYPAVFYSNDQSEGYTVIFPDLDIVSEGDSIEDAFSRSNDYLDIFIKLASKVGNEFSSASSYNEIVKLNPKKIVLLECSHLPEEKIVKTVLSKDDKDYNNFISKFFYNAEE